MAHQITTQQAWCNCNRAIQKYRRQLQAKPRRIHKRIFADTGSSKLDYLKCHNGALATTSEEIVTELHNQESKIFRRTAPLCTHPHIHNNRCTCAARQYPWHDLDGFTLEKRGTPSIPATTLFSREIYDECVSRLTKGKATGPDYIPNEIIKTLQPQYHDLLYKFFQLSYQVKRLPDSWKQSNTILLHKKDDTTILSNFRPISLACTIYKLFTSTLTTIISNYGEQHQILNDSQEGFRGERNTTRQIQMLLSTLEDAKYTNQDIYILYIDFKNAFGSIDHARLLAIMEDLGYPKDLVELTGNIYTNATTTFVGESFGKTKPVKIERGTIQGDTLSPYLFLIFLEPLLRWLDRGNYGYKYKTSCNQTCSGAYADDLAIIANHLAHIQQQVQKLERFNKWAGIELSLHKCALTGSSHKTKLSPKNFKQTLESGYIVKYQGKSFPALSPNEAYTYLGVQVVPSLKWKIQTTITLNKIKQKSMLLLKSPATIHPRNKKTR
jgi:hypothetical protein